MLCDDPFTRGGTAFPCGRCPPCLRKRKRLWTARMMMEAKCHEHSCFITLTYANEFLPGNGSLEPKHLQLFLKLLRRRVEPHKLRYFGVGEYGDKTQRPHYHVALFGYPGCEHGTSLYKVGRNSCCANCDLIRDTWHRGRTDCAELSQRTAAYVAGYVTKKMTRFDDPRLQAGQHPEFARMSLNPGIGVFALDDIASELMRLGLDERLQDVPENLRIGRRVVPLGRYLRQQLRKRIGRDPKTPQKEIDRYEETLQPLRQAARSSSEYPSLKRQLLKSTKQARLNSSRRAALYKGKRSL